VAEGSAERIARGEPVGRGLVVQEGRHGRGVFATRRFTTGETVEICPALQLPDADVTGLLGDYVFSSGTDGEVLLLLGYGSLYNHSFEATVECVRDEGDVTMTFMATRPIRRGDELTIDYGHHWWDDRGLQPD
jgi:hypothetical protein